MQALVTGGMGFLGSHLVDYLCGRGDRVTVVDDLSANVVPPSFCAGRCELVETHVEDFEDHGRQFDVIFHLAGLVGPIRILGYAGEVSERIVAATQASLRLASRQRSSIVYVSSSDVYGSAGWLEESARILPFGRSTPRAQYAYGKRKSELLVSLWATKHGVPANIVRPFNISGARQDGRAGFVIPRFVRSALSGCDIQVFGDGSQLRCFVHVSEVVRAMVAAAESSYSGEVWNVGNPVNLTSISNLAKMIADRTNSRSTIRHVNPKEIYGAAFDDGFSKLPIVRKLQQKLGISPEIPLTAIVDDVVNSSRRKTYHGEQPREDREELFA